jgi:hypothetical protein
MVMNLEKRELTLNTGKTAWYEYDQEGDVLEIVFRPAEATCAIELTESIILRFDWQTNEPLSLSFIGFSRLLQQNQYDEAHYQLLTDEWPEDAHNRIWTMLRTPPVSEFLRLSSYIPAHTGQMIPMAAIKPPHLAKQAA